MVRSREDERYHGQGFKENVGSFWVSKTVSDNGPPFSSVEFERFLLENGVGHTFSAPYHTASNGAAENAVKTCKRVIRKAVVQGVDV